LDLLYLAKPGSIAIDIEIGASYESVRKHFDSIAHFPVHKSFHRSTNDYDLQLIGRESNEISQAIYLDVIVSGIHSNNSQVAQLLTTPLFLYDHGLRSKYFMEQNFYIEEFQTRKVMCIPKLSPKKAG